MSAPAAPPRTDPAQPPGSAARRRLRIAFAGFHIESVSFLNQCCSLATFEASALRGPALLSQFVDSNTVPGGAMAHCAEHGIEFLPLVYAYQGAVGPASDEAVAFYAQEITDGLRQLQAQQPLDGVLLHLHGAAVSPSHRDVDAHLGAQVRAALGPEVPLVVAFDYHGNLGHTTLQPFNAAVAYRLSPHTDMAQTGRRAAHWLQRLAQGEAHIGWSLAKPKVVVPSIFSATSLQPLAEIVQAATQESAASQGQLDISVMAGFAYADRQDTGFSVLVTGSASAAQRQAVAQRYSDWVWRVRHALLDAAALLSAPQAVQQARQLAQSASKPVVLLEHADRMNDSTHLLAELLRQGVQKVAVPFLWDQAAAELAHAAGAGARLRLAVGAWSSERAGPRLHLDCEVLQSGPKRYQISGPMLTGQQVDLGVTAVVSCQGIVISLVSRFAFAVDEDAFSIFGQDLRDFSVIVLRSKTHFRAVFEPLAEAILIADTPDWGSADLNGLPYQHLDTAQHFPFNEPTGPR